MSGKYSYSFIKLTDIVTECLSWIRPWDLRVIIASVFKDPRIEFGIQVSKETETCDEYSTPGAVEM